MNLSSKLDSIHFFCPEITPEKSRMINDNAKPYNIFTATQTHYCGQLRTKYCDIHPPPSSLCDVYISSNTNMYVHAPYNVVTQSTHLRSRIVWRCSVLYTIHLSQLAMSEGLLILSLEPRLSVPDFVSQLWRKIGFFSKAMRQNLEWRA